MNRVTISAEANVRDLSKAEFEARYDCDRLTATVLANRYRYIVQHMCSGLLTTAFSIILRDWYDFAASISGPRELDYPMPAVSNSLILFLGTMGEAVRNSVEEYGVDELRPGDVLMANDPYRSGNHVNDVCFIRPVFAGRDRPVSFIALRAHLQDLGGVVPAGFSGTKRNVYENGLVLSPRLIYRDDAPYLPTWNLLMDNTRFAELLIADISSVYQNLRLGERLSEESIARYGLAAYHGAMRYACDVSAESMRAAITRLPDGVYEGEDVLDCDGADETEEYRIRATVRIEGSRAEVDFGGTSRQARTSINASWLDAKTGVAIAMMFLLDPTSAFTSGAMRDVDVVLPEGTVISARPPEGVIFLFFETVSTVVGAMFRALSHALGENAAGGDVGSLNLHNANGVYADGRPWVSMGQLGGEHGPWGATRDNDGDSYNVFYPANNLDPATEAVESDFPVLILRKEYAMDTAGAGLHRGGAGVVRDTLYRSDAEHYSMALRFRRPSGFGVWDGQDGMTGGVWVWQPDGDGDGDGARASEDPMIGLEPDVYRSATPVCGVLDPQSHAPDRSGRYFYFGRVPMWRTRPGTCFRYLTNGGGGWGAPLERDPEAVRRDVRDEYLSIERARSVYGVVVTGDPERDPEGVAIDEQATRRLRAERSAGGDGG